MLCAVRTHTASAVLRAVLLCTPSAVRAADGAYVCICCSTPSTHPLHLLCLLCYTSYCICSARLSAHRILPVEHVLLTAHQLLHVLLAVLNTV